MGRLLAATICLIRPRLLTLSSDFPSSALRQPRASHAAAPPAIVPHCTTGRGLACAHLKSLFFLTTASYHVRLPNHIKIRR